MEIEKKGIKIQKQAFDSLINNYIDKIKTGNIFFSKNDYVILVRVWNTITDQQLQDKSKHYLEFYNLFYPEIFKTAGRELHADLTKGMALYSKEYDLWF